MKKICVPDAGLIFSSKFRFDQNTMQVGMPVQNES